MGSCLYQKIYQIYRTSKLHVENELTFNSVLQHKYHCCYDLVKVNKKRHNKIRGTCQLVITEQKLLILANKLLLNLEFLHDPSSFFNFLINFRV